MIYFQAWWCLCICIFPAWDEVNIFWFIFMTFNILLYLTIFHQKVGNLSFYSFAIKAGIGDLVVWFCLFFPYCSTVAGKLDKICSGTMKCFLIQNLTSKRFFNEIFWNHQLFSYQQHAEKLLFWLHTMTCIEQLQQNCHLTHNLIISSKLKM